MRRDSVDLLSCARSGQAYVRLERGLFSRDGVAARLRDLVVVVVVVVVER